MTKYLILMISQFFCNVNIILCGCVILDNFHKQIKLKDIADSVHLSEIYFHNIFTESIGISPHQYLINCRIENAKKLL